MQLLYFDKNQDAARGMYAEFLNYRGMQWDLVHCTDASEAESWLADGDFDVLLFRSDQVESDILSEIVRLQMIVGLPPIISILDQASESFHLKLIESGVHDSIDRSVLKGPEILRRARMAEARVSAWKERSPSIDCEALLAAHLRSNSSEMQESAVWNSVPCGLQRSEVPSIQPHKLNIAHVVPREAPILLSAARYFSSDRLVVTRFDGISDCVDLLTANVRSFHTVVVENSVFECEKRGVLSDLDPFLSLIPCCVLTNERSDYAALSYIERGFAECLCGSSLSQSTLLSSLFKVVTRHRRQLALAIDEMQSGRNVSDRRKTVRLGANRRRHVRFSLKRPITAIPILPNGAPDVDNLRDSESVDVSLGGIGVVIPHSEKIPTRNWIIGVQRSGGEGYDYVSAYVRRVAYENRALQLGFVFQQGAEDFLDDQHLLPSLDPLTKQFVYSKPDLVLQRWEAIGVLRRELHRRVKACPECGSLCGIGTGCNQCGSCHFEFLELIHHFPCAHVAPAAEFIGGGSINCPKCQLRNLVVGADFEVIKSRYVCKECSHVGSELAQVGDCFSCRLRFPFSMAEELEIFAYHVDRLDILALVDAAR
jgi:DNA-binding response OmpR family regulator